MTSLSLVVIASLIKVFILTIFGPTSASSDTKSFIVILVKVFIVLSIVPNQCCHNGILDEIIPRPQAAFAFTLLLDFHRNCKHGFLLLQHGEEQVLPLSHDCLATTGSQLWFTFLLDSRGILAEGKLSLPKPGFRELPNTQHMIGKAVAL